jgi:hypothetical protein
MYRYSNPIDIEDYKNDTVYATIKNKWIYVDASFSCKGARAAVKKFFSALEVFEAFDGWKESVLADIENGVFKGSDEYLGYGEVNPYRSYYWAVEKSLDNEHFYIYFNYNLSVD